MTPAEFHVPPEIAGSLSGASFYGFPALQAALANHAGVPEANVFTSIGTSMANFVAMAALIEPGDEVVVEHPVYDLLSTAAGFLQAKIKWLPRPASLGFQPDLDALRNILSTHTKLIVLTNLHNPSSAFINEATLKEIQRLARAVGARVLVDEVYLDSAFQHAPKSSFHLGNEFVVTNSLTKVYGLSGLRCGWVVAEASLIERMWRLSDLMYGIPSHATERMSIVAFERIHELKARSRTILDRNRATLNSFLASRKELECAPAEQGMTVFPKLIGHSVDEFCDLLRHKYETTVVPGSFFEMPDHFRLSFGGDAEVVEEGLQRIGLALDAM